MKLFVKYARYLYADLASQHGGMNAVSPPRQKKRFLDQKCTGILQAAVRGMNVGTGRGVSAAVQDRTRTAAVRAAVSRMSLMHDEAMGERASPSSQ